MVTVVLTQPPRAALLDEGAAVVERPMTGRAEDAEVCLEFGADPSIGVVMDL
jgi:hypothetical protein